MNKLDGTKDKRWKGGSYVNKDKGVMIMMKNHPRVKHHSNNKKYIGEHVWVMEKHLGRFLTKNEVVHHINGNKGDNRIENLQILTPSLHKTIHHLKDPLSKKKEVRKKISEKLTKFHKNSPRKRDKRGRFL